MRGYRVARRAADWFPWTPLGALLCLGAYLGLRHFAYDELDMVWLVFAYALLSLLVLAPLLVLPSALFLHFRARAASRAYDSADDGGALDTGTPRATGFALPGLGLLPLVQVRWEWLAPAARVSIERRGPLLAEHVTLPRRGVHEGVQRRILVGDPFGVCRIGLHPRQARRLTVLPALHGLSRMAQLTSFAAGDELPNPLGLSEGDRLELRAYAPGDPVRFIHWKLLARTGELVVRVPERAQSEAQRVAAFLIAGPRDEASAAVARLALERGFLGREMLFATADAPAGVERVPAALTLLARSGEAFDRGADGLSAFFQAAARGGPTSFVLFVPPVPGPWLARAVAACRGQNVHVIIGVDGLGERDPSLVQRLLFAPRGEPEHARSALSQVMQRFAAAGASVAVYDRRAGRLLNTGGRAVAVGKAGRAA